MIVVTLQKLSCMLWLFSAFRGFKQCSNYKWDVTSAFGSKGRILKKLQIYWWMLRVEYINKSCLHDAIIWCTYCTTKYFKHIDGISKNAIPNLSVDEEISIWGNRMVLSGVIYHEGQQSHCRHYSSGVNLDNMWFLISDPRILKQLKLQCCSRDTSVLYILIYKKRSNMKIFSKFHRIH